MNESNNRTTLSIADMESDTGNAPVAQEEITRFDTPVNITITSYRKRLHDPDGVSVKAVLDGIVRRGILTDDSTKQIKRITFESIQSKEEKTIVTIESDYAELQS